MLTILARVQVRDTPAVPNVSRERESKTEGPFTFVLREWPSVSDGVKKSPASESEHSIRTDAYSPKNL